MNSEYKNRKLLKPLGIHVFQKYLSEKVNGNEINKYFKKFLDSEEREVEILDNAFSTSNNSLFGNNKMKFYSKKYNSRNIISLNTLSKCNNTDISNKETQKNFFLKNNKNFNSNSNVKNSNKNKKINSLYSKTFDNIIYNKNKINSLSTRVIKSKPKINNSTENNFIINNINTKSIKKLKEKNKINTNYFENSNEGLSFRQSKSRPKKILNFMEYYNINNKIKKNDKNKDSDMVNMHSISNKTINNIYQNPNKLIEDIFKIKDINSKFKCNIEKSSIRLAIKKNKFNKKYKRNEFKFFGNVEEKALKNNKRRHKGTKNIFTRYSFKEIINPKILLNEKKKKNEKTLSEEIKERKLREKEFQDITDNIFLNNNLIIYDFNKIDKRLRNKKKSYD